MKEEKDATAAVIHHPEDRRFAGVNGGLLTYEIDEDGRFIVLHTEVPERLRGQGIAAQLAEAALSFAERSNYVAMSRCEYVAAYMTRRKKR
ncbi:MAG: GNAT family N-acetyltransferase [Verrucomicrobiota bacterium JB024]|nr:GNAT family N-acetyltransferase [Verrucomicrobiota bacterium JB024]